MHRTIEILADQVQRTMKPLEVPTPTELELEPKHVTQLKRLVPGKRCP